ncbi:hypothetical protein GZ78_14555 [Endozoicomonas numazuensis]|uniref:GT44 domain-containing protein n=2 Tax=Endozoicomonas numazuensis TaxID=1137799 RepID=A0A081NF76_9GAMM|nr:hypothetical protein GZ78_14555 [Endozoicomonas numazuensis]
MPDYAINTVQRFCTRAKKKVEPYSVNLWLDRRVQYEKAQALRSEYIDMEKEGMLKVRTLDELNPKVKADYSDNEVKLYHQFTSREGIGIECQAARADMYRLEILRQEGGIYSDMDADFYPWSALAERFSCDDSTQRDYLEFYFRRKVGLSSPPKPFSSWSSFFQKISDSTDECKRLTGKDSFRTLISEIREYIFSQSSRELENIEAIGGVLFKRSDLNFFKHWLINNNLIGALPNHKFIKTALLAILHKYAEADSITQRVPYDCKVSLDQMDKRRTNPIQVLKYSGPEHLSLLLEQYAKDEKLTVENLTFNEDSSYLALQKGAGRIDDITFSGLRISEFSYEDSNKAHGARSWDKKPPLESFEL